MKMEKINESTFLFCFYELAPYQTMVYVVIKKDHFYIIDTYCGPSYMKIIMDQLSPYLDHKQPVIINTHHHWDHIWGNEYFVNDSIIAHAACKELIRKTWYHQKQENSQYDMDHVSVQLPTQTFDTEMHFKEDGLLLFHTPGHTEDSISIWDMEQHILFAGDNLEYPLIHLEQPHLSTYEATLHSYLSMDVKEFYGGHTAHLLKEDIYKMKGYLASLRWKEKMNFSDPNIQRIHEQNLKWLKYDK